jgi:hypothetical protein
MKVVKKNSVENLDMLSNKAMSALKGGVDPPKPYELPPIETLPRDIVPYKPVISRGFSI